MEFIFRSIFWIGVASLLASLFIDFAAQASYFTLAFGGGILLIGYALYEQYLLKKRASQPAAPAPLPFQPQPAAVAPPQMIAHRLLPLQELRQPALQPAVYPDHFLTRLFRRLLGLWHKHPPAAKVPAVASLENVKRLFGEELHLQRPQQPSAFQRPVTPPPVSFSRSLPQQLPPQRPFLRPTPLPPQEERLPFEEGLEHYVPTGAEQLPHDHHNRYAEEREVIARHSDMRYQQVRQQQRPSPQPSLPHHLSLLHYLHYKDRQHEQILFVILLCLSIVLIVTSLLLPFQEYIAFVVTLLFLGLLLLAASLAELIHLRRHALSPLPALQPSLQQPLPSVAQPQPAVAKVLPPQPVQQPLQPAVPQQPAATEHLSTLIIYVHHSLQQHYPLDAIRAAAQQSGWPNSLIEQAFLATQKTVSKKKKVLILIGLVVALLLLLFLLNATDMFLVPYWLELLSDASPQFYYIMMGVFLLIILLFVRKVRRVYKAKKIHYRVEEEQHIAEIKEELQRSPTAIARGTYETDFDRLYRLVAEKKKLTITEVAQGFNVSRKEAEEWGKILQEQGLIELHYPTVGDLELRWKK